MIASGNWPCRIGCAGWNVPKELRTNTESYLEQYSKTFNCTEIDSSFYRHHQRQTYERWATTVPVEFRFSVKAPKSVTHSIEASSEELMRFLDEISGLGEKLEVILLQFPPRKHFISDEANKLFELITKNFQKRIVCEPRHSSWFSKDAENLLSHYSISRVIADPKATIEAPEVFPPHVDSYIRLHGSPKIYYSSYSSEFLEKLRDSIAAHTENTWVIFDNTGLGHAFRNAASLLKLDFCNDQDSERYNLIK